MHGYGPLCTGCGLPVMVAGYCDDCRVAKVAREHRDALARTWARIRHGEVLAAEREERAGRDLAAAKREACE